MSSKMYDTKKINDIPIRIVAEKLGVSMKKKGKNMWTNCLWHTDRHASMIVGSNDDKHNVCHCFSCEANKNVISLIMEHEHVGWLDACRWVETYMPEYHDIYIDTQIISSGKDAAKQRNKRNEQRVNKNLPHPLQRRGEQPHKEGEEITADEQPAIPIQLHIGDKYNSSFARCLKEVFGDAVMQRVVDAYFLGAWKNTTQGTDTPQAPRKGGCGSNQWERADDVIFPSIDYKGNIRDLKVQAYQWRTDIPPYGGLGGYPGFFHSFKKCTYWLGPVLHPDREFDRDCLFGEHLLPLYPNKIVALVESPKNACVGFAQYPQYLWVAVGNKNMLKRSVLSVLKGRIVVIFPDEDAYKEWQGKIDAMRDIANFKLFHAPGEGEKRDIADWIIASHPIPPP